MARSSNGDIRTILRGLRPELSKVLRRHRVPRRAAADLLTDAALQLQAREGLLPGFPPRLLRAVERGARWVSSLHPDAGDYDEAFESAARRLAAHARRLAAERGSAAAAAAELLDSPAPRQRELLDGSPRHATRAVAEHLLELAQRNWTGEVKRVEPLADLALQVIARLDPQVYGATLLTDLRALASTCKGNARRILFDHRGAEAAFAESEVQLAHGTGDPRERAYLLLAESSLRRAQRRFDDALRLLDQARAIYRWTGDRHLEGRTLLSRAMTVSYSGDPDSAMKVVKEALERIDPDRDPRLVLVGRLNLCHYLLHGDHLDELESQLPVVRRLAHQLGSDADRLRALWLEARLAIRLDRLGHAERLLTEIREGFVAADRQYEAAVVSLDLVTLYLERGRSAEARELAFEVIPVFQSRAIHREALAALIALQRAFEMETATAELVREVSARVRSASASPRPPEPRRPS